MEVTKPKADPGDYTEEQGEFLRAVGDYRVRTGRHVLRVTDYFRIIQAMGYSKNSTISAQN